MSHYEQLLRDKGFVQAVINAVPNASEAFPHDEFLARFEKNVQARNEIVDKKLAERKEAAKQ